MSDAKTAAEIEDILSSIRRLVSQDRKAAATAPRPQILSRLVVEDRLILTPAQRIAPEHRPSATVTPLKRPEPSAAQSWPEAEEAFHRPARQEERAPGPSATPPPASGALPQDAAFAAGSVSPLPLTAALPPKSVSQRSVVQSAGQEPGVAEPKAQSAEPGRLHLATPGLTPTTLGADALAWESETGDASPDLSSLDWSSFTFARRPMAETYAARSRAAERLTAPSASQPIPAPEILRAPAPQPAAEPLDLGAETPEAEPVQPILQQEDSIFSEDVLRELVRDLIREQLQGDLGERITRNIRKLVKAEIARAISVQALE
jgi:hypothetical protein